MLIPPSLPFLPPPLVPALSLSPPVYPIVHPLPPHCIWDSPETSHEPSSTRLGDSLALPPATVPATPPRAVALTPLPPLLPPLAPLSTIRPATSPGSLDLPAPPGSDLASLSPWTLPLLLSLAPPSLRLRDSPQSHRFQRRPLDLQLQLGGSLWQIHHGR